MTKNTNDLENENIVDFDSYDLLIESWKLKDNDESLYQQYHTYESIYDEKSLKSYVVNNEKKQLKLSHFYRTHLFPQPWWGNIKDPSVIILALNPSYSPIEDDIEHHQLLKNGFTFDNLRRDEGFNGNWLDVMKDYNSTFNWWRATLGDLLTYTNTENFNNNVGIFNLCGYRSVSNEKIKSSVFTNINDFSESTILSYFLRKYNDAKDKLIDNKIEYNYNYLPTQNALILHLNNLIKDENRHVIVVWGSGKYKEANFDVSEIVKKDKLLIINKKIVLVDTLIIVIMMVEPQLKDLRIIGTNQLMTRILMI